jgi:hypothetical protein
LKKENPSRSAAQIRRILSVQHGWAPDERTLQRMFVRTGLNLIATGEPVTPGVFGRFEASRPNEIWTGDALCRARHRASYADRRVMPTGQRSRCRAAVSVWTGSA